MNVSNYDWDEYSLQHHALVYVVAEKYQIRRLRDEAYENMRYNMRPENLQNGIAFSEFMVTLRTIFTSTTPDSMARVCTMQACMRCLEELRDNADFVSLLLELPELGVEIIKHPDVTGDWVCTAQFGDGCEGLPSCRNCDEMR